MTQKKMYHVGWVPAILIMIFACGVVWWAAILIGLLSIVTVTVETYSVPRRWL